MNAANIQSLPSLDARPVGFLRGNVTAFAVALVVLTGWFDYVTGDLSLLLFYLVPVAIATWWAGNANGWFIGLLGASAWFISNLAQTSSGELPLSLYWNVVTIALVSGLVVEVLWRLHRLQSEFEERVELRTASAAQANAELEVARIRLLEADKVESIGRLAAGVAHEVKNPLMTISMAADYLSEVVPPSEPAAPAMIQALRDAVERADRVISETLLFARPDPLTLRPENLHAIIERALRLVKLEIDRKELNVVQDWCEPAPELLLDANKMKRVFVNLLLNAVQAMSTGGTLRLRTRCDGAGFTTEIEDTGDGISIRHQGKLFDPFFTTRPAGQGVGLGLSVARQIIQLHSGTLCLANRPEGGVRVTTYIPKTVRDKWE